ncbi:hypothetical protein [uncultured Nostoc sp.]|uniref:hypothetical protein n=1 Tax=uncultured Nostoc sp. TaxID=340711 RepID=UPI0035CC3CFB
MLTQNSGRSLSNSRYVIHRKRCTQAGVEHHRREVDCRTIASIRTCLAGQRVYWFRSCPSKGLLLRGGSSCFAAAFYLWS